MSARILVVDDNPLNIKLLAAKLAKDYYFVTSAENGAQAISMAKIEQPDLILLDVMMPEMDGFETCKILKADPETKHIPVVMVTALSDVSDRVRGLEAGADDFLTKPINDTALMARVRSSLRLKMMRDEWRLRESTAAQFSLATPEPETNEISGHILILEDDASDLKNITRILQESGWTQKNVTTLEEVAREAETTDYDLVILSLNLAREDGLYACAQLRAKDATRTLPILLVGHDADIEKIARGLDLGANDYLVRPVEGSELIARTRTQLRQKKHHDRLKKNLEHSLAMALVDPLTGAYNRRYLDMHLPKLMARCLTSGRALSVLSVDLDFFKKINDTYGHAAGDIVLKSTVACLMKNLRPSDLVVRMGGEEFALILPETEIKTALTAGERLREAIAAQKIEVPDAALPIAVTASFGVACVEHGNAQETLEKLLQRADNALYAAKETGRNRVVSSVRES